MNQYQDLQALITTIQLQLTDLSDRNPNRIYRHADYLAIDRFIQDLNSIKVSKDKPNQALSVVCMILEDKGCRYGKELRTVTMISLLSLMVLYTALYSYFPRILVPVPIYSDRISNLVKVETIVESTCYPLSIATKTIIWLDVGISDLGQLKTATENKLASILVGP